jgi:hypothetical protein
VKSLAELTGESDVIVRGTIADLHTRRAAGWDFSMARVVVADVLKGESRLEDPSTIDAQIGYGGAELAALRSSIPGHEHLFFLKFANDTQHYYPTDYVQVSVMRGIEGYVRVIRPDSIANAFSRDHFPLPLEGSVFEELVERVQEMVTTERSASQLRVPRPDGQNRTGSLLAC